MFLTMIKLVLCNLYVDFPHASDVPLLWIYGLIQQLAWLDPTTRRKTKLYPTGYVALYTCMTSINFSFFVFADIFGGPFTVLFILGFEAGKVVISYDERM